MKAIELLTTIRAYAISLGLCLLASAPSIVSLLISSFCLAATSREIRVLTIDGVINPLNARYFKREAALAAEEGAHAIILELNTPGGLESSMRVITQSMLNSHIPTIVYVTPSGARAASAGMFITIAANIAAMAPGTNIGAAHPVSLGERGGEQKSDETMKEKVVNDAAAFAKSIARERGRNMDWAERSVRKSIAVAPHEALRTNVIDIIARDSNDLLTQLNGRKIRLPSGSVTLNTAGVQLVRRPMHLPEKLLHVITDPNIAYLLITIGFIGIIAELYSPGLYFPGITGVTSLLLGFTAMGSLPIGWAGLVFLLLGIFLLVLETQEPGFGLFSLAGLLAFVLGSLMLYTPIGPVSPSLPSVNVSPWVIATVTLGLLSFLLLVLKAVLSTRRLPVVTGRSVLIGRKAIAMTDLSPKGFVKINHEQWSAVIHSASDAISIRAGEEVEVVDLEGAILKVKKSPENHQEKPDKIRPKRKS